MTSQAPLKFRSLRYGMLTTLLISMAGVAISGVALVVNDGRHNHALPIRVMITSGVLLLTANVGLLCIIRIAEGRLRWLMWLTLVFTLGVAAGWIVSVWSEYFDRRVIDEQLLVRLWSLTVANTGLVTVGQLLAADTQSSVLQVLRRIAAAWVALLTAFSVQLFWTSWWWPMNQEVGFFTLGAAVVTFVILGVLGQLNKKAKRAIAVAPESIEKGTTLRFTCPHCEAEQVLPSGVVRCRHCRRSLLIELEEPRCECGYLLFKLVGNTCPECGRVSPRTVAVEST